MELDGNVVDGGYSIRSLYFDNYTDDAFYEVENGEGLKRKWRIRIYNSSKDRITLERKQKNGELTYKEAVPISYEDYFKIIDNTIDFKDADTELYKEFILDLKTKLLKPACIVDYYRTPFVLFDGNVRITFDEQISYSVDFEHFFDSDLPLQRITQETDSLLEVKYDDFLPDFITEVLHRNLLIRQSYSKFYLCSSHFNKGEY